MPELPLELVLLTFGLNDEVEHIFDAIGQQDEVETSEFCQSSYFGLGENETTQVGERRNNLEQDLDDTIHITISEGDSIILTSEKKPRKNQKKNSVISIFNSGDDSEEEAEPESVENMNSNEEEKRETPFDLKETSEETSMNEDMKTK